MIIKICVNGQSMEWYDRPPQVADNSIEFVKFKFDLSPDWKDFEVVAQFTQTKTYNQVLIDGCCSMPAEIIAGSCRLSLFGQKGGHPIRATSTPLCLHIKRSGFVSSAETPIPPTPDLYSQLLEKLAQGTIPDSPQHGGFVAQPEPPDDKSLLWIDTDDETSDEPETEPGGYYTPTVSQPDANTMEVSFAASAEGMPDVEAVRVTLPTGKTPVRGVDYWTDADKQEIAEMAAELVEVPEGGGNSGDGGSGVSDVVLVNMTVAEDADVIDIPVTAEMANIFNSCPELWFECEFRMPAADSANANGNVTISENAGSWDSIVYFKDLGLIPSNNASYNNPSRLLGIVYQTSQELMALYTLNVKNSTTKGGTQYGWRQKSVAGRHVRFKGTHAIGAGTILKIIAKGVSA